MRFFSPVPLAKFPVSGNKLRSLEMASNVAGLAFTGALNLWLTQPKQPITKEPIKIRSPKPKLPF